MTQISEELKRISRRMMDEKRPYYDDSKRYLNSIMRGYNQEELIDAITALNIHELKQCLSAGVPGDAMHIANMRLKDLKAELKAYIDEKGSKADMKVELDQCEGGEADSLEGIHTLEEGREGDSGAMGDESTDTREEGVRRPSEGEGNNDTEALDEEGS